MLKSVARECRVWVGQPLAEGEEEKGHISSLLLHVITEAMGAPS